MYFIVSFETLRSTLWPHLIKVTHLGKYEKELLTQKTIDDRTVNVVQEQSVGSISGLAVMGGD